MAIQIQLRRDVAAAWALANPVLASGEVGLETDTVRLKIGDGATAWNALPYRGVDGAPGGTVYEIDVDLGAIPVLEASMSWAHVGATVTQRVIASAARMSDEQELDPLVVSAFIETNDVITATVAGLRGPIAGIRRLYYTIGV